jgi:hypothetical protein
MLCCAGWSGLVFRAMNALNCLFNAWHDCVGHGFVAGAWFLAALLTAVLPLQVFVPPHRLWCWFLRRVTLSPVSKTLAGRFVRWLRCEGSWAAHCKRWALLWLDLRAGVFLRLL